jgi:hypothetical protein
MFLTKGFQFNGSNFYKNLQFEVQHGIDFNLNVKTIPGLGSRPVVWNDINIKYLRSTCQVQTYLD